MTSLEQMAPSEVGERLRIAREAAKITQADAATAINVARTTIVAIEQGQRRIRMNELQKLAKLYRTSVNALLRQEAIYVDLVPRFRKTIEADDNAAVAAADVLASLAKAEVELEDLLGVKRTCNYPPERPLLAGDVRMQAEQNATELRERLGLGIRPISDIVTLLEMELGVRVYVRRLESGISGLFAFDDALGPCMLLNANHPKERRNHTAGHETGHFLSTRKQPDVFHDREPENSREERYANAFARALLTPARAVMQKFHELTADADRLTRRHVIILSHFFGTSREAMVRRLEELALVKSGTWDWFESNGSITAEHVRQVLGDLSDLLQDLIRIGIIDVVKLDDTAARHFEQLVVGPAAVTLDDGEAATIAYTAVNGGIAIFDESKAIRIACERFPDFQFRSTVDLFARPEMQEVLGAVVLAEALFNALRVGRMRVFPQHVDWVIRVIGFDRAAQCVSLSNAIRRLRRTAAE